MLAMLFVTISSKEAEEYAYLCIRLKKIMEKIQKARKSLEAIANASFDKPFAKCVYMLTSESLQCENEIRSQINSLNCDNLEQTVYEKEISVKTVKNSEDVCDYFEEVYLKTYRKLLKDKHLVEPLKNLIENHLQSFMWMFTQVKLFNDVKTTAN
jgi:hypothetical protein